MYIHTVIDELIDQYGVGKLTKVLGCSRTAVYSWKARTTAPTATFIPKIAKLSGISADVLLSENGAAPNLSKVPTPGYALEDIAHLDKTLIDTIDTPPSLIKQYPAVMHVMQLMDELIEKHGTTELAKMLQCSRGAVYSWQTRRTVPNIIYLKRISDITGLSADVLLSDDGKAKARITSSALVYALEDIANPDKQPIDTIDAPPSLMQQYPAGIFYKVGDTSINKYAPQGSYVLVDHDNRELCGLVVALHQQKVISGLCHKGTSSVLIAPQTYNDDAQDVVAAVNDVKVLGKVVFYMGVIRE